MAEGGEGTQVQSREWWYGQFQKLLENSYLLGETVDSRDWWITKLQEIEQLYEARKVQGMLDDSEDWWKRETTLRLTLLSVHFVRHTSLSDRHVLIPNQKDIQEQNYRKWWFIRIKQMLDAFVVQENEVDLGYCWYRQIHLLLDNSYVLGETVDSRDWWISQIRQIQQRYGTLKVQAISVSIGEEWWNNHLTLLFNSFMIELQNSRHWWFIRIKQLLDDFVVQEMLCDINPSWYADLRDEFKKTYFIELSRYVYEERHRETVYPIAVHVFSWTSFVTVNDVKVVIVGQDPYHGPKQAHGLAFSIQEVAIPPSLENIYAEIKKDYPEFQHPGHGSLIRWAEQGVLLLNTCLTVREGEPHSHRGKGWEIFTRAVISRLVTHGVNIVFMLWGDPAQSIEDYIDNNPDISLHKSKHKFLQASHPAPQSYRCTDKPFCSCQHFYLCNQYLKEAGKSEVDWNTLKTDVMTQCSILDT